MKELTKVFNGTPLQVEMLNDKEFMVNVSGIANKHGKKFSEFENRKSFKEYLKEVEKSLPLNSILIDKEIHNKTMIHSKILIEFARWLSPEFAVWCNEFIYDYLTSNKEAEIAQLKAEKKLCKVENGFSSIRGVAQRSRYSESDISVFCESLGLIERKIKPTLVWNVPDTCEYDYLVTTKSKHSTPYVKVDDIIDLMDQLQNTEE